MFGIGIIQEVSCYVGRGSHRLNANIILNQEGADVLIDFSLNLVIHDDISKQKARSLEHVLERVLGFGFDAVDTIKHLTQMSFPKNRIVKVKIGDTCRLYHIYEEKPFVKNIIIVDQAFFTKRKMSAGYI
jgi:hypothetical protein